RTPCSASASAVAGPIAATRFFAIAAQAPLRAASRRSTMATPFTLVKITHANESSAASAVSSGSHDAGGSITIVGACRTRAPAAQTLRDVRAAGRARAKDLAPVVARHERGHLERGPVLDRVRGHRRVARGAQPSQTRALGGRARARRRVVDPAEQRQDTPVV